MAKRDYWRVYPFAENIYLGEWVKPSVVCTSSVAVFPATSLENRFEHPNPVPYPLHLRSQGQDSRFTNDASRLLREFFDEVAEFGKDEFFHGQAHGVF